MISDAPILVVDERSLAQRGGIGRALSGCSVVHASNAQKARRLAARMGVSIAVVHAGHDGARDRPAGGVLVAAEISRYRKGISLLLVGEPTDLTGWVLLHEYGACARFLLDNTRAADARRVLRLLADEASRAAALSGLLGSLPEAPTPPLETVWLTGYRDAVEERLIRATLHWTASRHQHAALLGIGEGGLRAKMRKLSIPLPGKPSARSHRDRMLVIGSTPASLELADALARSPHPVVVIGPGALHAGVEATAGARAAVAEAGSLDAIVDMWALRQVAPRIPILLHGPADARARALLHAVGGLPDPLSLDEVSHGIGHLAEALIELGCASTAADAACLAAGGIGQNHVQPRPIDLNAVVDRAKLELARRALLQESSEARAAALLRVSARILRRVVGARTVE